MFTYYSFTQSIVHPLQNVHLRSIQSVPVVWSQQAPQLICKLGSLERIHLVTFLSSVVSCDSWCEIKCTHHISWCAASLLPAYKSNSHYRYHITHYASLLARPVPVQCSIIIIVLSAYYLVYGQSLYCYITTHSHSRGYLIYDITCKWYGLL